MAQDSVLLDKSLHFAARVVKLHRYLTKEKHEAVISKQILRSATSIGANANEAIYCHTKADLLQSCISRSKKPQKRSIGCVC